MPLLLPVCSTVRNFDRSSVRSRSFKRLNRAFSVLRRTKSGNAVSNETSEERDNARNSSVPQEGTDHSHTAVLTACVLALHKNSQMTVPEGHQRVRQSAYLRVYFQGDTAGSPECNSSICCFNNSAAHCISLLVHHQRSIRRGNGGPRHFRRGEVTGDEAADTIHHILPNPPQLLSPPLPPLISLGRQICASLMEWRRRHSQNGWSSTCSVVKKMCHREV